MSQPQGIASSKVIAIASTLCWAWGTLVLLIGFAVGYPALAKQGNIVPLVVSTAWGIAFGLGGLALRQGRWGVRWWVSALCSVSIVALLLAQATISLLGILVNAVVLVLLMISWKSLGRRT
jgi:hypothetical protein